MMPEVRQGRVPMPVVLISGLVIIAASIMMFWGAWVVGATWDERTHVIMLQTFLGQGWNVTPEALLSDGTPDPNFVWYLYVYGPVAELVAHASSALLGIEQWSQPVYTAESIAGWHVGIAFMGLVGTAATGLIVRLITNSWKYAFFGAAALSSLGLWVGHAMFNIKDLPVASGYTMGTLGIVAIMHPRFRSSGWIRWGGSASLVLGAVLAAGTRAATGAPLVAAAVGAPVLLWLLRWRSREAPKGVATRDAGLRMLWSLGALVVGYLILIAIYPNAYADPLQLGWHALVVSARFPYDVPVLTAGMWLDQPPPWFYLPLWFGGQLSLLVIAGSAVAILVWAIGIIRRLAGGRGKESSATQAMVFAVILQLSLVPLLGILLRSNIYDAQRQFLFAVPAFAVLAVLGVRGLAERLDSASRKLSWLQRGFWALVGIGLVVPTVGQALLMPYNYVYFNPAAAVSGINDRWQTDYWRASSNELMRRTPANGPEFCAFESGRKGELSTCSIEQMFEPYVPERGSLARNGDLPEGGYWLIRENKSGTSIPENCTLHDQVTRPLWGKAMVIGQIFACSP